MVQIKKELFELLVTVFFLSQKNLFYRKKTSYGWVLQVCNKAQVEEGSDGLAEGVQSDDEGLSLHCHIKADTPIL